MKRTLALGFLVAGLASCPAGTVAIWTFESPNIPPTTTGTTISGLLPSLGSGTASGVHASSATTFSSPVGNGSAHCLSGDYTLAGDYWQFQVSTVGFTDIHFSLDQIAGAMSMPTNCTFAYSLNGSSFIPVDGNVAVTHTGPAWNETTRDAIYNSTFDLGSVTALDNADTVFFRLTCNLGWWELSYNTWAIDNVTVSGTAVPEPANLLLWAGIGLVALFKHRHHSRS